MGVRVLLIEDDATIAEPLVEGLAHFGLTVHHVSNGTDGLRGPYGDVVLLDLGLPDMDGIDVCRGIRQVSDVPVIILSARGEEADRVLGLELGADDYLAKPFSIRELVARVRAVTRRTQRAQVGTDFTGGPSAGPSTGQFPAVRVPGGSATDPMPAPGDSTGAGGTLGGGAFGAEALVAQAFGPGPYGADRPTDGTDGAGRSYGTDGAGRSYGTDGAGRAYGSEPSYGSPEAFGSSAPAGTSGSSSGSSYGPETSYGSGTSNGSGASYGSGTSFGSGSSYGDGSDTKYGSDATYGSGTSFGSGESFGAERTYGSGSTDAGYAFGDSSSFGDSRSFDGTHRTDRTKGTNGTNATNGTDDTHETRSLGGGRRGRGSRRRGADKARSQDSPLSYDSTSATSATSATSGPFEASPVGSASPSGQGATGVGGSPSGTQPGPQPGTQSDSPSGPQSGPLVVDRRTRQVWVGDSPVSLTPKEFELIALLTEDPGAVYSRQQILDRVWDPNYEGPTKTLDVHVATLRRKLGNPAWIQTLRGVGFRLAVQNRPPSAGGSYTGNYGESYGDAYGAQPGPGSGAAPGRGYDDPGGGPYAAPGRPAAYR